MFFSYRYGVDFLLDEGEFGVFLLENLQFGGVFSTFVFSYIELSF
jgi:hypothetical protein